MSVRHAIAAANAAMVQVVSPRVARLRIAANQRHPLYRIEFGQGFADKEGPRVAPAELELSSGIPEEVHHVVSLSAINSNTTELTVHEYGYTKCGHRRDLSYARPSGQPTSAGLKIIFTRVPILSVQVRPDDRTDLAQTGDTKQPLRLTATRHATQPLRSPSGPQPASTATRCLPAASPPSRRPTSTPLKAMTQTR